MSAINSNAIFKSTAETYGLLDLLVDGLKCLVNKIREAWANRSCSIAQHTEHSKAATLITKYTQTQMQNLLKHTALDNEGQPLSPQPVTGPVLVTTTTATEGSYERPSKVHQETVDDLLKRFEVYSRE